MAKTKTAPWDYDKREGPRTDADDEILAGYALLELQKMMGYDAYQMWKKGAIKPGMSWWSIFITARDMQQAIRQSADECDYRETCNTVRPGGG